MSGFGLYETLRILVPGALAALITDFVLRVAVASDVAHPSGSVADFLKLMESPIGAVASALAMGLILYLIDFPAKSAIYTRGAKDWPLPSTTLRELLKGSQAEELNSLGLYFLISDRFMSAESHRRVYWFGSLYRVFVDFRMLLAVGGVLGPATALFTSRYADITLRFSGSASLTLLFVVGACVWIGWIGERSYARNVLRKARRDQRKEAVEEEVSAVIAAYREQRWSGLRKLTPGLAAQLMLGAFAVLLLRSSELVATFVGFTFVILCITLWCWIEMGPSSGSKHFDWRAKFVAKPGEGVDEPNFRPIQRLASDLSLFLPWLIGGSVAVAQKGQPPYFAGLWSALVIPCITIMAIRKHEIRLLGSFREQSDWLKTNDRYIKELRENGTLADLWKV